MMNIKIICVGRIKEIYFSDAIKEYIKRISKFSKLEIIEVIDEKLPTSLTLGNSLNIKDKESESILNKLDNIKGNKFVIALDEKGKEYSSEKLANHIDILATNGNSTIVFIIGGSLGLSEKVKEKADELLSFSALTFPHQMIRLFLVEQIFRVFKILGGENYHH